MIPEQHPCDTTGCGNTATGTVANPHYEFTTKAHHLRVCTDCRDELTTAGGYHIIEPIRPRGRDDQDPIQAAIDALPNGGRVHLGPGEFGPIE